MSRAMSLSISASVCVTLMWAERIGSAAQSARRATAASTQAERVPAGGCQSPSGAARSSSGRSGPERSGRRVVAATALPAAFDARKAAAPISPSPPIRSLKALSSPSSERGSRHLGLLLGVLGNAGGDLRRHQTVDVEQIVLYAVVVRELVGQAEAQNRGQGRAHLLDQEVGNGAAEAADLHALFHRRHQLGIAREFQHRL